MVVTFVRIDDRMIHGQTVTRWAKEKPFDPSLQRRIRQENLCMDKRSL